MNPLFFGQTESPLYGVYHPPQASPRDAGVVLCYPFGQEYMRAHRAYRQLSLLLTRKGFHVLRFDYRGTGDSSGELDGVRADDWVQDIGDAVQELRDTAGMSRVSVLGLRLGGLFATMACSQLDDIECLMLWDPVISGRGYADELVAHIAAEVPNPYGAPSGNALQPDGSLHYNGFTMPARFRESMKALDLMETVPLAVPKVLQVVSHETTEFSRLRDVWRSHPGYRYQYTPAPHNWNYVDNFGGILLPQPVIQALVNWMEAQERP